MARRWLRDVERECFESSGGEGRFVSWVVAGKGMVGEGIGTEGLACSRRRLLRRSVSIVVELLGMRTTGRLVLDDANLRALRSGESARCHVDVWWCVVGREGEDRSKRPRWVNDAKTAGVYCQFGVRSATTP